MRSLTTVSCSDEVIIDFKNAHVWDHSAVVGLQKIKDRYERNKMKVSIVGLNNDSHELIHKMDKSFVNEY